MKYRKTMKYLAILATIIAVMALSLLLPGCQKSVDSVATEQIVEQRPQPPNSVPFSASQQITCAYQWISYSGSIRYQYRVVGWGRKATIQLHHWSEDFTALNNIGINYSVSYDRQDVFPAIPGSYEVWAVLNLSPQIGGSILTTSTVTLTFTLDNHLNLTAAVKFVSFGCN